MTTEEARELLETPTLEATEELDTGAKVLERTEDVEEARDTTLELATEDKELVWTALELDKTLVPEDTAELITDPLLVETLTEDTVLTLAEEETKEELGLSDELDGDTLLTEEGLKEEVGCAADDVEGAALLIPLETELDSDTIALEVELLTEMAEDTEDAALVADEAMELTALETEGSLDEVGLEVAAIELEFTSVELGAEELGSGVATELELGLGSGVT